MNQLIRFGVFLCFAIAVIEAQTTAWLRVGGPDSRKAVLEASNSRPIVISSPNHGFQEGDVVWLSFVNGNTAANGVRRIKSVSANSFAITDLQGHDIAGNGTAVDFNSSAFPGIKGYVGKAQQSKILEAPGMLLDGPSGSLTSQVRDPDGPGGAKAPKANAGWAPYAGMQRRLAQFISNPERSITIEAVSSGAIPHLAALDWYMDNSRQQSLQAARYWVNNVEKFLSVSTFTACDESYKHCGRASFPDWMSFTSAHMVYAYSLIRSELTPMERKAFADKMLNDQGDENGCQNTLQDGVGTVSVAAGSNQVIGVGTQFLTEYASVAARQGVIKLSTTVGYPSWATVKSVESDTQLTLVSVLSASNSYQNIMHGRVNEWVNGSCGVKWYVSHHGSSPNIVTKRLPARLTNAISESSTRITVDHPANFSEKVPFSARIYSSGGGEVVKVLAVEGNTFVVQRGVSGTSPRSTGSGTLITIQTHPGSGGIDFINSQNAIPLDAPNHNLVMAKVYGYITLGMGLAGDDPRAVELLQDSWNYYYDFQYPLAKAMWTGITQGGYAYGPNRWMDFTFRIAASAKNSFEPSIDISDGNWLKNLLDYPIYTSLPYQPNYSIRFADSGSSELTIPRFMKHILMGNWLLQGSSEAKEANYWYRHSAGFYDNTRWYDTDSQNSLPYALIYTNNDDAVSEYKNTRPPFRFFTQADINPSWNGDARYNAVVSRQSWNSDSTYLWATAFSRPNDHLGSYTGPGSYKILKNQYLIGENGAGTQGSGAPQNSNSVQIGIPTNLRAYNYDGGQVVTVDRQYGSDPYVYFRVNSLQSYKKAANLNYIYRHFVHLKSSPQDYIVVYDDVNTNVPMDKISRVHYYADNGEKPEFSYEGDLITFKREKAMISTRVLLPLNAKTPESLSSRNPTANETIHAVALNSGTNTTGEFLVVHRPSTGGNDRMPEAQVLDVNSSFRGILIHDQTPKVVLFSRGNLNPSAVNFTIPGTSVNHEVIIAGLAPGAYSFSVNGRVILSNQSVGTHGSLLANAPAGNVSITRVGVAQLEIGPERPSNALVGSPFMFQFSLFGGEQPYQWVLKSGYLPPGLQLSSNGALSGTPQQTGSFSPVIQVTDATGISAEIQIHLEVTGGGGSVPLSVSIADLPAVIVAGEKLSFQLDAYGGSRPYEWKLISGTLPVGLSMDESGLISGTPVTPGKFPISVQVMDSSGQLQVANAEFTLEINSGVDRPNSGDIEIIELPEGFVGSEYFLSLPQLSNINVQTGWLMNHGEVPNGMYMDMRGQLSGVPVRPGVFTFSVRIMRQTGPLERFYMIKIN